MFVGIRELTEEEKKDAVTYMKAVSDMSYDEFEQWKKKNVGWSALLINWCRIRHEYPELNKIWEERFVRPDKEKRFEENKNKILADMSKRKAQFIAEHMISEEDINHEGNGEKTFRYRIIHYTKVKDDFIITLGIPYDALNLMVPKFGATVEFYKSMCPDFFDEVLKTYKRFDGKAVCTSYAEKYNRKFSN